MSLSTPYDLVIFDCDGTLVDSEYLNNLAFLQLLEEQGLTQYDMDYAYAQIGRRFKEVMADIIAETGHDFPENMTKQYIQRVHDLAPTHLKQMEGAIELVEQIAQDHKICVASNGQRDNVIYGLELTDLKHHFPDEHIFTAIEVKNPKPAPDLFLRAATRMEIEPIRALVLEDSPVGVKAALNAGMDVIGFTGGHPDQEAQAEKLRAAGANKIVNDLLAVRGFLV